MADIELSRDDQVIPRFAGRAKSKARPADDDAVDIRAGGVKARAGGAKAALYDDEGKPRQQSAVLIGIGFKHDLFHDAGGDAYARVLIGKRKAILPVVGTEYRDILSREFYSMSKKGCNRNALTDAVSTLSAIAKYDKKEERVFLRVANVFGGGIEIDVGDETGDAVIITASGWTIGAPTVNFRRSGKPMSLPRPTRADFARIWKHVNVAEADRPLVAAWLLAALRPRGPYPITLLIGEQGTGKSATSRILKLLTDPSAVLLRPPPREDRDLQVATVASWCIALDNLSGLNPQLSDCLCRVSTGGGFAARKLYTDTDETLIDVQRPIIINGIDDIATRPDLADRCLHLLLPQIAVRRTEAEIESGFSQDAPAIFAGLLDSLSLAIKNHGAVRLANAPRMADFATWAVAGLPALGFTGDEFLIAYRKNRDHLAELSIEASPVASALVGFMAGREKWAGSSGDLLDQLSVHSPNAALGRAWPRSPKGLMGALRRVAPALRGAGLTVEHTRTEYARQVVVCKAREQVSDASDASGNEQNKGGATDSRSVRMRQPKRQDVSAETRADDTSDTSDASKPTLHTSTASPEAPPAGDRERF
jgi:hypothetical protein